MCTFSRGWRVSNDREEPILQASQIASSDFFGNPARTTGSGEELKLPFSSSVLRGRWPTDSRRTVTLESHTPPNAIDPSSGLSHLQSKLLEQQEQNQGFKTLLLQSQRLADSLEKLGDETHELLRGGQGE